MLTVAGKSLGGRKPLFEGFSVPPPPGVGDGSDPIRLRDLIAHIVIEEVAAFETRQQARRLDRVLSPAQIDAGAERGKISPEGRDPKVPAPKVNVADAVQTALEAFTDGLYLVVLDDVEQRDLDTFVSVGADSRLVFVRLTFLAGA